ncbi:MAG: TetR/AcrR family transcriptional regulator [Melioribacteraceae bacterium]|nr:TetR/AcrR family transcriptional regulator [Melioribacteraceae bacterium]
MKQKTLTRKEREREFKRSEILNAAIQIFAMKGFKAATLDEIAEKSEFGKGTIYNYFSSKEEIYKEIILLILKEHKKSIKEVYNETDTLYDFILNTTKRDLIFCLENKEAFFLLVFTKMHHEKSTKCEMSKIMNGCEKEITSLIIKRTKLAIKNKEIRKLDSERIIRLFKISGFAYIYDLLINENLCEATIEEEAKFITDILFNGIKFKK